MNNNALPCTAREVAIIDYGAGNLRSVAKAFAKIGAKTRVISSAGAVRRADSLVLPGVGAFAALEKLGKEGRAAIREAIASGIPFLGICLGMQTLFKESEESPGVEGLAIFEGKVERLQGKGIRIPQMGWNQVEFKKGCALFKGIPTRAYFYFANSYSAIPGNGRVIAATTDYGSELVAVVARKNVFGVQFHPEKSGEMGLKLLRNFVELAGEE